MDYIHVINWTWSVLMGFLKSGENQETHIPHVCKRNTIRVATSKSYCVYKGTPFTIGTS